MYPVSYFCHHNLSLDINDSVLLCCKKTPELDFFCELHKGSNTEDAEENRNKEKKYMVDQIKQLLDDYDLENKSVYMELIFDICKAHPIFLVSDPKFTCSIFAKMYEIEDYNANKDIESRIVLDIEDRMKSLKELIGCHYVKNSGNLHLIVFHILCMPFLLLGFGVHGR